MRARLSRIRTSAAARRSPVAPPAPQALPGWFISVEGGDGAGKSTQIAKLAGWLRGRGYAVVTTREPGATDLGIRLREILLHARDHGPVGARAEALLFAADRADHVEKIVRPALERGAVVLTDRHVDSSIAYQSGGRGLPAEEVAALSAFATDALAPDLTVLLDIDPAVAWQRAQSRPDGPDRLESEPTEFHARVRAVFRERAAARPDRYLVVDATEPVGVVAAVIEDRLASLLPPSPREAAEAAERERMLRDAQEAERREQETRRTAELAEAEQAQARARAEQEEVLREAERQRAEAARQYDLQKSDERARLERERTEQAARAEADGRAAELREAETRRQSEADAQRRREAEQAVREAEVRAKAQAREQAARDLAERAQSEERTAALVEQARVAAQSQVGTTVESAPAGEDADATGVLPDGTEETRVIDGTSVADLTADGGSSQPAVGRWPRGRIRR